MNEFFIKVMENLNIKNKKPRIPKGSRDFGPEQMGIREEAFKIIIDVFKKHGAVTIDTPVFELKQTLIGKYGDDQKLIYDLMDQGGELLALRYDLTVPFARYLAMYVPGKIKRYHIGKVYRRDQPMMNKGRYREFYQCDFDIAGNYNKILADVEVIVVAVDILKKLNIGDFIIRLNHRILLNSYLLLCGVPSNKFKSICSAIDKLDKEPWDMVALEMQQKGLSMLIINRIKEFVSLNSTEIWKIFDILKNNKEIMKYEQVENTLIELKSLFEYLELFNIINKVSFDLSLARGLDYYTGLIFECVVTSNEVGVGSVAAGGRYDDLVGMFNKDSIPCVGISIGIERIMKLLEERDVKKKKKKVNILISSIGSNMLVDRMKLLSLLWEANITAESSFDNKNIKLFSEITWALDNNIPYMIIIGKKEIDKNTVQLKNLYETSQVEINRNDLLDYLINKLKL